MIYPSHIPFEFVEYESGKFCARRWIRVSNASRYMEDDYYDEVEAIARMHADLRGVEIDIISCAINFDSEIVGREREGFRVRPSHAPYESAFGPVES